MASNDFIESAGYLRVLEKKILTGEGIGRILDAPTPLEALKLFSQNSVYDFSALQAAEEYDEVLNDSLVALYREMYNIAGESKIMEITAAKYDFHNIKVAVKAKYQKVSYEDCERLMMNITRVSPSMIFAYVTKKENAEELPEHIRQTADEASEAYDASKDPQNIDVLADKKMYAYMLMVASELKLSFAVEYVKKSIDYFNLKTFLRVKNMQKGILFLQNSLAAGGLVSESVYSENYDKSPEDLAGVLFYKHFGAIVKSAIESYSQRGNFSDLERRLDDALIEHVKASKYITSGPELILSYIISRENEMRQIRIIMSGKINDVKGEILKERLRENYV